MHFSLTFSTGPKLLSMTSLAALTVIYSLTLRQDVSTRSSSGTAARRFNAFIQFGLLFFRYETSV